MRQRPIRRQRSGSFYVDCDVAHLRRPERRLAVPKMLVDAGAASSWVPERVLRELGIRPAKDLVFQAADGRTITRSIGYAFLRAGELETVDEVVFAQPGDPAVLGARTLAGFGARVDPRRRRLVPAGPRPAAPERVDLASATAR